MSSAYEILEVRYSVRQELVPQEDPESVTSVEESVLIAHVFYKELGVQESGQVVVPLGLIATKTTEDDGYGNPSVSYVENKEFTEKLKTATYGTFIDEFKKIIEKSIESSIQRRAYDNVVKRCLGLVETRAQYDQSPSRFNYRDPINFGLI